MRAVVAAAGTRRCRQREHDAQHGCEREGGKHQQQREARPIEDEAEHRLAIGEGEAEVALGQVPQIEPELMRDRLVQPELLAHLLDVSGRRREIADQRLHRIARHEMHDQEVDDQDRQHDRHRPRQPSEQVAAHQAALPWPAPWPPRTSRRVRAAQSACSSSLATAAIDFAAARGAEHRVDQGCDLGLQFGQSLIGFCRRALGELHVTLDAAPVGQLDLEGRILARLDGAVGEQGGGCHEAPDLRLGRRAAAGTGRASRAR